MTTLEFLQAILPERGVYYLALMQQGRNGVAHKAYTTIPDMAAAVAQFDARDDITVYHACAAYKEPYLEIDSKKKYRVPQNRFAAKALWVDIDCGEAKAASGAGYPTKRDGAAALLGFCKETGFPTPLLVDSGNGIHAYWPLTEAIPPSDWLRLAETLKAALAHFGVIADPTRTADFASILRPVGSTNKKDPANPKPVIAKSKLVTYSPVEILAALTNIVSNFGVECYEVRRYDEGDADDELTAHAYPEVPTDADLVAEKCAQVRHMKETGGGSYEQWRRVIGILKFCENGEAIAHQWSSQADGYDAAETQQKLDTWNTGPTTCEAFKKCNPDGCNGCTAKVTTPLMLGRIEPVNEEAVMEAVVEEQVVQVDVPALPKGYTYDDKLGCLVRFTKDKDGNLQAHEFSRLLFYPTTRICQTDATFTLRIRAHMLDKSIREFDIPTYVVAVGGTQLITELGKHEIAPTNNRDSMTHLTAYMRDSLQRLLQHSKEMNTMTTFGWNEKLDSFLLGDRLYMKDGSVRRVLLGGHAAKNAKSLPAPKGSTKGWADPVNHLYARDGMEPMQYALCSGFGSVLSPFGEELYFGIPVALTGSGSGKGKTTVCRAALYAFGDAAGMTINGDKGATINARGAIMGAFNNVPVLIDEITKTKGDALSDLLYAAANGKDKIRLKGGNNGTEFAEQYTWCMSLYMTANKHLSSALAADSANTEAEAVRYIEIQTDTYKTPLLDTMEVGALVSKIARNAGSAGADFVQWCVTHTDEIADRFVEKGKALAFSAGVTQNPQYRYYRQHAVCTLVAADILVELGILTFDLDKLFAWTVSHMEKICADVVENNTVTGEEAFNRMINDLSPRIIVTSRYGDGRGVKEPVPKMSQAPAGRYIQGTYKKGEEPLEGRLYMVKKDVRDWCLKNRVPVNMITDYTEAEGILIKEKGDHFNIGRGTEIAGTNLRCWAFDMTRADAAIGGVPNLTVLTNKPEANIGEESAA